jgi:hypothetical protein
MTPRALRIVALCYLVKTLLLGIAWLAVPDLPHRLQSLVRSTLSPPSQGKASTE